MSLIRSPWTLVALAFSMGIVGGGCPASGVGIPCVPNVSSGTPPPAGGGTTTIIDPGAVDCPTQICLLPPSVAHTSTGPLCSAECSSDEDCDGEVTRDSTSPRCKTGFACRVVTTVGELCCRKFCACRDFVQPPELADPAACKAGSGSSCRNAG